MTTADQQLVWPHLSRLYEHNYGLLFFSSFFFIYIYFFIINKELMLVSPAASGPAGATSALPVSEGEFTLKKCEEKMN